MMSRGQKCSRNFFEQISEKLLTLYNVSIIIKGVINQWLHSKRVGRFGMTVESLNLTGTIT